MEDRLLFIIGSPRSGSTLLARMLGAHSTVHSPAEPHLLTPLAHLGYYDRVERAAYDPIIARQAMQALVASLPRGEKDYLDALRAYSDRIYTDLLAPSGRAVLLDKTPAYALVLDFVVKLYPDARYIVLTRHPLAVWTSFVDSFWDGDHEVAHARNPLLERYVPAIARFLREAPVRCVHVQYEQLVAQPEPELRRICDHTRLAFEPGMIDYGNQAGGRTQTPRGLGDPITAAKQTRPTTASLGVWAQRLAGQPARVAQCQEILARLADEDLAVWGYDRKALEAELAAIDLQGAPPRSPALSSHVIERRLAVVLRRNIHHNAFGRLVKRIRYACDVLLR